VPLPTGAKLNNVWIDMHVLGAAASPYKNSFHYGVRGLVMEVEDPGTAITYEALWDEAATKDSLNSATSDFGAAETDIATSDVIPNEIEYEPGLIDLEELMGYGLTGNMEIFKRQKMTTFASNPIGWDPASGGTYVPTDQFKTQIKNGPTVRAMSVAMFGFSSPAMDIKNTNAALELVPSATDWFIYQFLDTYLEDMFKYLIGTAVASTTDPYQDAYLAITDLLEAPTWEPDDNLTLSCEWQVHSKMTWDVTMPGMNGIGTISSE
jgi:hypothetical protein